MDSPRVAEDRPSTSKTGLSVIASQSSSIPAPAICQLEPSHSIQRVQRVGSAAAVLCRAVVALATSAVAPARFRLRVCGLGFAANPIHPPLLSIKAAPQGTDTEYH